MQSKKDWRVCFKLTANVTFDADELCGANSQQYFCLKQALQGIATLRNKEWNLEAGYVGKIMVVNARSAEV